MAKEDQVQFVIHIDGDMHKTSQSSMTGAELKQLAGKDQQYQIFLEGHGNESDRMIGDTEGIPLKNGMHFYTVPPATFG